MANQLGSRLTRSRSVRAAHSLLFLYQAYYRYLGLSVPRQSGGSATISIFSLIGSAFKTLPLLLSPSSVNYTGGLPARIVKGGDTASQEIRNRSLNAIGHSVS